MQRRAGDRPALSVGGRVGPKQHPGTGLLARAFRSIVLAIKAVQLNLVSLAAAFGILVFVFQQGDGSSI